MNAQRTLPALALAGLAAGPAVWAVHQQIGYMLVPVSCQMRLLILPPFALLCIALVLGSGLLSWRAWRRIEVQEHASGGTRRFLAALSFLFAALFAFAILLQGAAMLFLDACQR